MSNEIIIYTSGIFSFPISLRNLLAFKILLFDFSSGANSAFRYLAVSYVSVPML